MSLLDLTNVSESTFEAGEYTVTCSAAEVKETKAGTGEYIKCTFETDKGQRIYHNFNIKNSNEKAVQIGLAQLKTFMRVAGKANPNTLGGVGELLGLKCVARVKIVDNDFGSQPNITTFKALGVAEAQAAAMPF
jgi:hypothetical protein